MEIEMPEIQPLGYRTVNVTWWNSTTTPKGAVPKYRVTPCILDPDMYPEEGQPDDSAAVLTQLKLKIAVTELGSLARVNSVIIESVEPVCNCGPGGCKYSNGERFFIRPHASAMLAGRWDVLFDDGRPEETHGEYAERRVAEGRPDVLEIARDALRRKHHHR